jgi:hypothetical protein
MIVTKKHLPRRTMLRGIGVSLALPLLDGMIPALQPLRATAAAPVKRFTAVYVGNGADMARWTPAKEGALELSPILTPLEPFRDRTLVLTGLDSKPGDGLDGGTHPRMQTSWLTGAPAKRAEATGIGAGVSVDQIIAKEYGRQTQLASLELAIEPGDLLGTCSVGYSCAYHNTISWRTSTTPVPMENNPRAVFERLFGLSDSTESAARLAEIRKDRSILDSVTEKITRFEKELGAGDRTHLRDYLEAVRDVERRIQKAEEQIDRELPVVEQPVGIPGSFEEHVRLMFDLLALAYQVDLTRVGTFLMVREASIRAWPEIGVPDSYHPLSHHGNDPEKLARQSKVNAYTAAQLAYFLQKLRSLPDGEHSLYDQTLVLYGSGMSDSNLHLPRNLPTVVVGSREIFGLQGGQHVRYTDTPLANLHRRLLESMGTPVDTFGDSSGLLPVPSLG